MVLLTIYCYDNQEDKWIEVWQSSRYIRHVVSAEASSVSAISDTEFQLHIYELPTLSIPFIHLLHVAIWIMLTVLLLKLSSSRSQ